MLVSTYSICACDREERQWGVAVQSKFLGVGSVDKRVVVVDDMIAVRPMCYLTLGYDHRLIDGADAGRFLQALKERLQDFDEAWM